MKHVHKVIGTAILTVLAGTVSAAATILHVAPDGNDTNPGTEEKPLATLQGARDRLRAQKPAGDAVVEVHAGDYFLSAPFRLDAEDSAAANARITYRAHAGDRVRLIGGVAITGFVPFKGSILQANVSGLALEKIEPVKEQRHSGSAPGFELFFQGKRMPLARWPNKIPDHPRWGEWAYIPPAPKPTRDWFHYGGDRPGRWARPAEAQIHWFPHYNYFDQHIGIRSVDADKKIIHLDGEAVMGVYPGRRYYVRNVFEELDAPGEWYFDARKRTLYFWPPEPLSQGKVVASRLGTVVRLDDVSNVTVRDFIIESCTRDAVVIAGGANTIIGGCVVRNARLDGIRIASGTNHAAIGNDIYDVGRRGILLEGGDRKTLTPGRNRAVNNHVHHVSRLHLTYAPGIAVNGCGNLVQHNLLHDGPHMLLGVNGNDHVFEYNDMHHAMLLSSHGGALYGGRDWTQRGHDIRYNAFHDINGYGFDQADQRRGVFVYSSPVRHLPGAFGIHLDDQLSGFHIYGNLFYRFGLGVIRAGGGRDIVIENNIFVHTGWAVHIDSRGITWQKQERGKSSIEKRLDAIAYKSAPWSERYPELVDILEDRPGEPVDNVVRRNIFLQEGVLYSFNRVPTDRFTCDQNLIWRGGKEVQVAGRAYNPKGGGVTSLSEWQKLGFDTHSLVAEPGFVDLENDDYRLRPDSPAWTLGFKPIPFDKIGLVIDEYRRGPLPPPDPRRQSDETVVEEYPIPDWTAAVIGKATLEVPQAGTEIKIDGSIQPAEWSQGESGGTLLLDVQNNGRAAKRKSHAWVTHDGESLLVAIRNEVHPNKPLSQTTNWGRDDAVEIAIQDAGGNKPVIVLRGFPCGKWHGSTESGAPAALVRQVQAAAEFAAAEKARGTWEAEWRVPLAAMNIRPPQPAAEPNLRFNITVFKAADRQWVMWVATQGKTWNVENAGMIQLTLPGGG
ncbi:MAG: right-handed parallel beta-helix repeat-containing protein [Kiritimatiellae bacterium]|nr:right-handed parallel beta-helix repeat-containing protein [Kiritimatiellia bacterium]